MLKVCQVVSVALFAVVVPNAHANYECWAWSHVVAKGWTCGGSDDSSCTCPESTRQEFCTDSGTNYYHCKDLVPEQCPSWDELVKKGFTCGGHPNKDCSCPDGLHQESCTSRGTEYYNCKEKGAAPAPAPPSNVGIPDDPDCSCTEQCRPEGWCNADCENNYDWDNCKPSADEDDAAPPRKPNLALESVGQFMADFAQSRFGEKVPSDTQGTSSCWDLAMRAIEEARKAGYPIQQTSESYQWSNTVIGWDDAQPGDIMQFRGWRQKYMWAGDPHTALVKKGPVGDKCVITALDQNPDPVHESKYDTCSKSSGEVTIYRVDLKSSRLRLFSADVAPISVSTISASTLALVGLCASALVALVGVAGKRYRASHYAETESELLPVDAEEQ